MIQGTQIERLQAAENHEFHDLMALTKSPIETVFKNEVVQLEFFDETLSEAIREEEVR